MKMSQTVVTRALFSASEDFNTEKAKRLKNPTEDAESHWKSLVSMQLAQSELEKVRFFFNSFFKKMCYQGQIRVFCHMTRENVTL